jgi:ADP-ribose pyrophosphatase YjhB (NUDIX family)
MTLGAQGIVIRDGRDVLLIRHGYRPGWHFPGGGVEWNETLLTALAREVREETGVIVQGEPRLHGIFANFHTAPCDHVAVYLVEDWEQPSVPSPSMEIREQAFFPLSDLPIDIVGGAQRRIAELFQGHPIDPHW